MANYGYSDISGFHTYDSGTNIFNNDPYILARCSDLERENFQIRRRNTELISKITEVKNELVHVQKTLLDQVEKKEEKKNRSLSKYYKRSLLRRLSS